MISLAYIDILWRNLVWPFTRFAYIDLIEKNVNFQLIIHGSSYSCSIINRWTKCNHAVHLSSVKVHLKPIFSETKDGTLMTIPSSVVQYYIGMDIVWEEAYHPPMHLPKMHILPITNHERVWSLLDLHKSFWKKGVSRFHLHLRYSFLEVFIS